MDDKVTTLRRSIEAFKEEHDPKLDSVLYNGGTLLALAATIAASAFPWDDTVVWIPRVLAGFGAFLIGAERALNFGERWRFHRDRHGNAESLMLRLDLAQSKPADELDAELTAIAVELARLLQGSVVPMGQQPVV